MLTMYIHTAPIISSPSSSLLLLLLLLLFFFYFFLPLLLLLSYMCRLFAGFVPRVCWISLGGFIFLGAYEKSRHVILTLAAK